MRTRRTSTTRHPKPVALRSHFLGAVALASQFLTNAATAQPEHYVRAEENAQQQLVIHRAEGTPVVLDKRERQENGASHVGFRDIAVAADGSAVGWVAYFDYCCTSYPIPLLLEVYRNGLRHTFDPAIAPWHWCFVDGTDHIAAVSATVHGPANEIYEQWEVGTGKLKDQFHWLDGELHPDAPAWVHALRATREARAHECDTQQTRAP